MKAEDLAKILLEHPANNVNVKVNLNKDHSWIIEIDDRGMDNFELICEFTKVELIEKLAANLLKETADYIENMTKIMTDIAGLKENGQ